MFCFVRVNFFMLSFISLLSKSVFVVNLEWKTFAVNILNSGVVTYLS